MKGVAFLAVGWAWTMLGSRDKLKPENCLNNAARTRQSGARWITWLFTRIDTFYGHHATISDFSQ
jgi:hypothetical protein